jgi:transposase
MKTQIQKPSHTKTRYTEEFKRESYEYWKKSGRSAAKVAAELGIRAPLLYRWQKQYRVAAEHGGQPVLKAVVAMPPQKNAGVDDLRAEIRRLSEENAKLLEQREVLKKSLGILSEMPPRGMSKSNA